MSHVLCAFAPPSKSLNRCTTWQRLTIILSTVGVHPDNEDIYEPTVQDLVEKGQLPRVIAIGETGLDYYQMSERKGAAPLTTWNGSVIDFVITSGQHAKFSYPW